MSYYKEFIQITESSLPSFEEITDPNPSPTEVASANGFEATRVFVMGWADRTEFIEKALGFAVKTTLYMPLRYPANTLAIATEANVAPMGECTWDSTKKLNSYEKAMVTLKYTVPEFETRQMKNADDKSEIVSRPWVSESIDGAAEFITVPASGLYWDKALTDPLKDTEAPGILNKLFTWVYTLHRMPEIPEEVFDLVGCVNSRRIRSYGYNRYFEPETLLFGAPSLKPVLASLGFRAWDITLTCTHNSRGWNKVMRKGGKLPQEIYASVETMISPTRIDVATGQYKPYEPASFAPIFEES